MNNDNFVAAVLLSIAILVGFHFLYEAPKMQDAQRKARIEQVEAVEKEIDDVVEEVNSKEKELEEALKDLDNI